MKATQYKDINEIINKSSDGILKIFGSQLVGIYLFGSLSYGDFNLERSDIDLVTIISKPASPAEAEQIKNLHQNIEKKYPDWAERIEASYTPLSMFSEILPPAESRPYFGEGEFYWAQYGNEWIVNNYLLYKHGIAIVGPDFKTLIHPIAMQEVQKACVRDLFKEWEPKLRNPDWLNDSHYQSYLVLNLCRILYTVFDASLGSKKVSANWVKTKFPEWSDLIQAALSWHYGLKMSREKEAVNFLRFVIDKVSKIKEAVPSDIL